MKKLTFVLALAALTAAPVAAAPPSLTLKATPTVVVYGGTTTLSGTLSTQQAGESIDIQAQECGQNPFKKLASVTTTTGGAFSYAAKPTINTSYRAREKGATSPNVVVQVAPKLVVRKTANTPTRKFVVALTAAQSFVGKYVVFQRRGTTRWVTIKKVTLTSVKTTTAPTMVTSQRFSARIKRHPMVRVVLPIPQAGTCYQPAASKAIRS